MNCFVVISPGGLFAAKVADLFPENHSIVADTAWVVAGSQRTCSEVYEALQVEQEGLEIVVVKMDDYYGLFDRALWEKVNDWRTRS